MVLVRFAKEADRSEAAAISLWRSLQTDRWRTHRQESCLTLLHFMSRSCWPAGKLGCKLTEVALGKQRPSKDSFIRPPSQSHFSSWISVSGPICPPTAVFQERWTVPFSDPPNLPSTPLLPTFTVSKGVFFYNKFFIL